MNDFITNSDINSLGTLISTFTSLSHTWLSLYSTGDKQGWQKPTIYQIGLASFTMANKSPNTWYFGDNPLPLIEISNNTSLNKTN